MVKKYPVIHREKYYVIGYNHRAACRARRDYDRAMNNEDRELGKILKAKVGTKNRKELNHG